jgi:hypothetical protein
MFAIDELLAKIIGPNRTRRAPRPASHVTAAKRLHLQELEARELLSGDWFDTHLPNPSVAALARTDWYNHYAINYNDMLGIYTQIERDGVVDTSEFTSLQNLTALANVLHTPDSVGYLETQVINHNPANLFYQGSSLGYLAANSPAWRLQELVAKWFLGQDHPAVAPGKGITYKPVGGNLFGSGGPAYADIAQGGSGDCALMASLAVTAAHSSGVIQSMFTANGNNTLTVRFYENGYPVYVTVDNQLPFQNGQTYYDHPQNGILWAALAEKAYAGLNAFDTQDGVATTLQGRDAYTSLGGLDAAQVLPTLTGRQGYAASANVPGSIAQALVQGSLVVLGTGPTTGSPYVVPGHAYAVLDYNASTQKATLFNPWGFQQCQAANVWALVEAPLGYLEYYCTTEGGWVRATPTGQPDGQVAGLLLTPGGAEGAVYAAPTASPTPRSYTVFTAFTSQEPAAPAPSSNLVAGLAGLPRHGHAHATGWIDPLFARGEGLVW